MNLYSTNNHQTTYTLKEAVLRGLPPDNGLFMPTHIPALPTTFWEAFDQLSFQDLSFEVSAQLLGDSIPDQDLRRIIDQSITFDAPLRKIEDKGYILELFHGPTLAFKDFGARFMAQLMSYLIKDEQQGLHILVATSGDTGGAVANGFYQTEGIHVTILYPSGKVSYLQEKQLTTLGENITALEIDGTFDDCQAMVKQAFLDTHLNQYLRLTSANSINIARLIPQSFYYFRAFQQLPIEERHAVFVIPSGNFGNLTAGMLASRMGLAISKYIAATNVNDIVPSYLITGKFQPRPSVRTISNAMDVGNPSNFARMMDLYAHDHEAIIQDVQGYAYDDTETRAAIRTVYTKDQYIIDPHGAVGYLAWKAYCEEKGVVPGVILGTAHPAKFIDVVEEEINGTVELPPQLSMIKDKPKKAMRMEASFEKLKSYLMESTFQYG